MKKQEFVMKKILFVSVLGMLCAGSGLSAQTTIYVHGYKMWVAEYHRLGSCNDQTTCTGYWKVQKAGDVRHVGWNGAQPWITSGVDAMTVVLNNRCRRDRGQQCNVVCHSTGCPITAYMLDKRNPIVGGRYTYNIARVQALGSAEGGSDLADDGTTLKALSYLPAGDALSSGVQLFQVAFTGWGRDYLKPSYLRNKYTLNHDNTAGASFRMVAGNSKGFVNWVGGVIKSVLSLDIFKLVDPLIGQDDGVVAFHSSCAYAERFYSNNCSSDWKYCCRGFLCRKGVTCEVRQWSNHRRIEACGRGACNKNHSELADGISYHSYD